MKRNKSRKNWEYTKPRRKGRPEGRRPCANNDTPLKDSGAEKASRLSRDEFATALVEKIHDRDSSLNAEYDPGTFTITLRGKDVFNLENFYRRCVHPNRSTDSNIIDDVARSIASPPAPLPEDFISARARLVPVLRSRLVFDKPGSHIPFSVIADGLAVSVACDGPDHLMHLADTTLAQWGVSFDQAYESAVMNLRIVCESRPFMPIIPGLYVSEWYDGCDSARLVLSDVIRSLPVKGAHVAMAPLRDLLIVTGSEDFDGLGRMLMMAQEVKDDGYCVSHIPLALTGAGWITWRPAQDHPFHRGFHDLYVETMAQEYAAQATRLQAEVMKDGVIVPKYFVLRRNDGGLCSLCVWLEEAENLLPKTDLVYFQGGDGESPMPERSFMAVPWDQVMTITGITAVDAGYYPPRFRVKARLSDEQLMQLQQIGGIPPSTGPS